MSNDTPSWCALRAVAPTVGRSLWNSIVVKKHRNGIKNLLCRAFDIPFHPFLECPRIEVLLGLIVVCEFARDRAAAERMEGALKPRPQSAPATQNAGQAASCLRSQANGFVTSRRKSPALKAGLGWGATLAVAITPPSGAYCCQDVASSLA
jgi:hypothetical protein